MTLKVFFRRIHLYLALVAGLVIMVTCLTGAILVFEKELMQLFNKDRYFTTARQSRLPIDSLIKRVKTHEPTAKVSSVKIYSNPERTAEISFTKEDPSAKKKKGEKPVASPRLVAFTDPYTGAIHEVYNHRESFFYFVMDLNRWMLGGDTGKLIVGICTVMFLFILITGIVLWWPRNRQLLKQRLRIKRDAGFKRLNHDYHIVFGFYSAIFLFVFAFTGLAWSFEWFNKGIYTITGTSMERAKAPKSEIRDVAERIPAETALTLISEKINAPYYSVTLPKDSTDMFSVTVLPDGAAHESATDTWFVDPFQNKVPEVQKFTDRNTGQKVRATFKPIHVASIYGNFSKVIGLIVCLLGTFFPASGYIMWYNRTRKKKKMREAELRSAA